MVGTRIERNDYTGAAWLRSLRLGWQPSGRAMNGFEAWTT